MPSGLRGDGPADDGERPGSPEAAGRPAGARSPAGRSGRSRRDRLTASALFAIACALVFPNLGDRCLWQDEAETALVAVNVLRTGLPSGWDGRLLVTQAGGLELTDSFLWAWTPWLMHYVAAAGMAVMGESSLGARWPFALIGCLSFPLFYLWVVRTTKDRVLALLAVILMLTSVQYLLLMRQCRYYPLLPALFVLSLWGYGLLPSRRGVALFSLGLVLLFHGNYVSCAMAATGFLLHAALFRRRDSIGKALLVSGLIAAAGSLPWIAATGLLDRAAPIGRPGANFVGTLILSNRYVCSWLVLAGLVLVYRRKRHLLGGIDGLCLCTLAPIFVFLPRFLWPNPRYVSFLLPIGALLVARAIREAWGVRAWLGVAVAALSIGSNALVVPLPALVPTQVGRQLFSGELETGADAVALGWWKREFVGYGYELTHSVRGPDEELVAFLAAHAGPDDLVCFTNDWLPAMFHTRRPFAAVVPQGARARLGWSELPPYLWDWSRARWLVLRPQHPLGSNAEARAALMAALPEAGLRVEKVFHLDVHDVQWINRPILSKHVFRMPEGDSKGVDVLLLGRSSAPGEGGGE